MQELMYLEQLFGRGNSGWMSAAMLLGLLLVLVFRPNAIRRPILFRVTCWLLALTVVIPPFLSLLLSLSLPSGSSGYSMRAAGANLSFIFACANFIGPVLQGACILCGLTALMPPLSRCDDPTGPAKHPLE
jgi:hypothetical protein